MEILLIIASLAVIFAVPALLVGIIITLRRNQK